MSKHPPTRLRRDVPAYAAEWLRAHPRTPPAEAAPILGVSRQTVRAWRSRLIKAGELPPLRHTRLDVAQARDFIADGLLVREAAARLRTHPKTLVSALARADLTVGVIRDQHVYSAEQLAPLFGVSGKTMSQWLYRWKADGLIDARRADRRTSRWRVTHAALMAFLDHPDAAPYRARVVDPEWRTYLDEIGAAPMSPIRNPEIRRWFGAAEERPHAHAAD